MEKIREGKVNIYEQLLQWKNQNFSKIRNSEKSVDCVIFSIK